MGGGGEAVKGPVFNLRSFLSTRRRGDWTGFSQCGIPPAASSMALDSASQCAVTCLGAGFPPVSQFSKLASHKPFSAHDEPKPLFSSGLVGTE